MMIEIITFNLPEGMSRDDLIKNYHETVDKWRGVNDLIRKSYIFDEGQHLGGGVYHWKNVEATDQWHGADWKEFVKNLYGSYPIVRRFDVPLVADNELSKTIEF